jgi:hypothetical protein
MMRQISRVRSLSLLLFPLGPLKEFSLGWIGSKTMPLCDTTPSQQKQLVEQLLLL